MPLSLPLLTYDFADGQYVIAAAPSHAQLLGARVVAVNGVPIQQVVERIAPIISRDNAAFLRANAVDKVVLDLRWSAAASWC